MIQGTSDPDSPGLFSNPLGKIRVRTHDESQTKSVPPSPFAEMPSTRPVLIVGFIGGLLSLTAGYMNALCFVLWDRGVTHVTGLLICFLFGAILSSFMVGAHRRFLGGYQYSPVLATMGTVVLITALVGVRGTPACLIIAFVSGMQNAMSTFYSGAIVRTTHMTGTLTDIGIEVAKLVRGMDEGWWKFQVLSCFFLSFFLGGVIGTTAAVLAPSIALIFPIVVYYGLAIGNCYYHYRIGSSIEKVLPVAVSNSFTEVAR